MGGDVRRWTCSLPSVREATASARSTRCGSLSTGGISSAQVSSSMSPEPAATPSTVCSMTAAQAGTHADIDGSQRARDASLARHDALRRAARDGADVERADITRVDAAGDVLMERRSPAVPCPGSHPDPGSVSRHAQRARGSCTRNASLAPIATRSSTPTVPAGRSGQQWSPMMASGVRPSNTSAASIAAAPLGSPNGRSSAGWKTTPTRPATGAGSQTLGDAHHDRHVDIVPARMRDTGPRGRVGHGLAVLDGHRIHVCPEHHVRLPGTRGCRPLPCRRPLADLEAGLGNRPRAGPRSGAPRTVAPDADGGHDAGR